MECKSPGSLSAFDSLNTALPLPIPPCPALPYPALPTPYRAVGEHLAFKELRVWEEKTSLLRLRQEK